jgi:hypothetical protein
MAACLPEWHTIDPWQMLRIVIVVLGPEELHEDVRNVHVEFGVSPSTRGIWYDKVM